MSMRCPVCFAREIDIVLFQEGDEYYCIKCSFTGTAAEIDRMYAATRKRFRNLSKRLPPTDGSSA